MAQLRATITMVKIRDIDEYVTHVAELDRKLRKAAVGAKGHQRVKPTLFNDIVDRGTGRLLCANAAARIAFACEAESYLRETLDPSRSRQAFLVTFCPSFGIQRLRDLGGISYATPSGGWTERERTFEGVWRQLIAWTKRQLVGFSYLGAVDVAYYRTHPQSMTMGPVVCLHTHLLMWGRPRVEIDAVCHAINASDKPFVLNLDVANVRPHNGSDGAVGGLLYALKPPLDEYKIRRRMDKASGTETWKANKDPLRPGNAALTASLFTGIEIDQITFAGGAAGGSVDRIAAAARARLAMGEEEQVMAIEQRRLTRSDME